MAIKKVNRHRQIAPVPQSIPAKALGILVIMTLVMAFVASQISNTSADANNGGGPSSVASKHLWCGVSGLRDCPDSTRWIPLRSVISSDVASAIQASANFVMLKSRYSAASLDVPMLVHSLMPAASSDYFSDDHWVVSIRDASGVDVGVIDFAFDRAHSRMRLAGYGAMRPGSQYYGHTFPFVSTQTAVSRFTVERHIAVAPGSRPILVFFQLQGDWLGPEAPHHRLSGGSAPTDPVWLIKGADYIDYIVGTDLRVFARRDLPIAQV